MDIKPHHWITAVGNVSRRRPPKYCQPAAYYDQQAIDALTAEVERLSRANSSVRFELDMLEHVRLRDNAYLIGRAEAAEAEAARLRQELDAMKGEG